MDQEQRDMQAPGGEDPDARAFTGHPDHPPAAADQPVEGNRELLDGASPSTAQPNESGNEEQPEAERTPGQGSDLPGYG